MHQKYGAMASRDSDVTSVTTPLHVATGNFSVTRGAVLAVVLYLFENTFFLNISTHQ